MDKKQLRKRVIALMIPILIQNGITNLVSMLDNLMVGRVGYADYTGVSVANQLIFVFTLCIFGAVSGAGIFGAQFFGRGDHKGLRDTFRFKVLFCLVLTAAAALIFVFAGGQLINMFLQGEGEARDIALSFERAKSYLNIMLIGLLPFTLVQCYSSTLRESGQTILPMAASIAAVVTNLVLNYILIFGHFGAPALGSDGAAVATVISRFVELAIVAVFTFRARAKNKFIVGAFRSFKVPLPLVKQIVLKGMPLILNETMWAAGAAAVGRYYSLRGLNVVSAYQINNTFFSVFSVAFMSVGVAIGIILGQMLGAGEIEEAKPTAKRLMRFSVFLSIGVGAAFAALSPFVPQLYNTGDDVKNLATGFMLICAATMPFDAYANAAYFTLRSGGQALITIIFDSGFSWAVSVPAALILARFTDIPILPMYAAVQSLNFLKDVIGFVFVKKGKWAVKL